jgi:glycosyltransferase involved in cell wall biosynthesis
MSGERAVAKYVIISPVKDERKYIETTIKSVVSQTVIPLRWIIVDDGSRDGTSEVIRKHSKEIPWIELVKIDRGPERRVGRAEVSAFIQGYSPLATIDHEFVVKLDGDLDLPADYFEKLFAEFRRDDTLGIASGIFFEKQNERWSLSSIPDYHAAGASKVMRVECYRQIGGFIQEPGWDTVDEIRARARGWKTCHFKNLIFYHLRPEGSSSGYDRRGRMCGAIDYRSGTGLLFFLLKAIQRMMFGEPRFVMGFWMSVGFFEALVLRKPKLVTAEEERLYRKLLNTRITARVRTLGSALRRRMWAFS